MLKAERDEEELGSKISFLPAAPSTKLYYSKYRAVCFRGK
jgi:hypothetical protein